MDSVLLVQFRRRQFDGYRGRMPEVVHRRDPVPTDPVAVMKELEALLIVILNTRNTKKMRFQGGELWKQVPDEEWASWVDKVCV